MVVACLARSGQIGHCAHQMGACQKCKERQRGKQTHDLVPLPDYLSRTPLALRHSVLEPSLEGKKHNYLRMKSLVYGIALCLDGVECGVLLCFLLFDANENDRSFDLFFEGQERC